MAQLTNKEIVLQFIDALNKEDFAAARDLLNDGFKFVGVLGTRDGADVYISDMEHMKLKYTVKKSFEDGNDVAVFCDYIMGKVTVLGASWYQLENGKLSSLKAIFDPRPVLEGK